jgi:hypothetical protein
LCDAQLPNKPPGATCKHPAGYRTDHLGIGRCYRHGGATQNHVRAAAVEQARTECARLSIPIEVDPAEALLGEVFRTAGWVATYEQAVQELPLTEGEHWRAVYHQSGGRTGEAKPHVLVELLFRERQHLKDVTVAALRAKIDERRIKLVEDQAQMVHRAFEAALDAAKVSAAQRQEARQAYGAHLKLVA